MSPNNDDESLKQSIKDVNAEIKEEEREDE